MVSEGFQIQDAQDVDYFDLFGILDIIQLCAGLVCCLASLSLPRRPNLTHNDQEVDGEFTVTALARYNFAWAAKTLQVATNLQTLNFDDVPDLQRRLRSEYRERLFTDEVIEDHLIKRLIKKHSGEIMFQFTFAAVKTAVEFTPQIVMFAILSLLEQRSEDATFYRTAWALVLALGAALLLSAWGDCWTDWMCLSRIGLPVRAELSGRIFTKAMQRKDVKGGNLLADDDDDEKNDKGATDADDGKEATEEEGTQKTRQAMINLIVSGHLRKLRPMLK